ncbi:MAG: RNA polymerase-binding protein RbpA [Ruaniaceae bacterium]|nr:RNA polymerase-binding protein RbpA [Ruaniaceae bacterium]
MASGSAIRGTRVGSGPLGESERGELAPRVRVPYWCVAGHETVPRFSTDADTEIPLEWECSTCGLPAGLDKDDPPQVVKAIPYKTHLAYVKERRTDEDGVALLDEALANLRGRRGG